MRGRRIVILPGQYFDEETGLSYNYFRDYDPTAGRYVESDPIGISGGINAFGYARQNSLRWADRLGLVPNCFDGVAEILRFQDERIDSTVLFQYTLIVPIPMGIGVSPNLTPLKQRRPPIRPGINTDFWLVEYQTGREKVYQVNKTVEMFTRYCEETSVDGCGEEQTLRWQTDKQVEHEEETLLDTHWFFNRPTLIRKLGTSVL